MSRKIIKKLRVVVLVHETLVPPDKLDDDIDSSAQPWRTEYDVISTLRKIGHEVWAVGVGGEISAIREAIETHKPQVIFNLLEEFDGYPLFDQHVVAYLELQKQRYTGCNARGMMLARDKALTKKILAYHRIRVPRFAVFPLKANGRSVERMRRLRFPLFVKSLSDEGSASIAQASIVHDEDKLKDRVAFIHHHNNTSAIAEEFIEGREIYVAVIGNKKLQAFTPWELILENLPEWSYNIASGKVKWDGNYQERIGVVTEPAKLEVVLKKEFERLSKRMYRILELSGYARFDYRMTPEGRIYLIEVNTNPQIARYEDFAESAEHCGLKYEELIQKIITLGMSYDPLG